MAHQLARSKRLRKDRARAQANEEGKYHADELGAKATGHKLSMGRC